MQLKHILDEFLRNEPSGRNAPFVKDVLKRFDEVSLLSKELWFCLEDRSKSDLPEEAVIYADCMVERHCNQLLGEASIYRAIERHLLILSVACGKAKDELSRARTGFEQGQAWRNMVARLVRWARGRDYPASASKGTRSRTEQKPSPFVAFIRELQVTLPAETRRHTGTAFDQGLSRAVSDVLREVGRRDIESEN